MATTLGEANEVVATVVAVLFDIRCGRGVGSDLVGILRFDLTIMTIILVGRQIVISILDRGNLTIGGVGAAGIGLCYRTADCPVDALDTVVEMVNGVDPSTLIPCT